MMRGITIVPLIGCLAPLVFQADAKLIPFTYDPLPLGSVTANGWLQTELETLASGLGGHLHEFWPFVSDSSWTGGKTEYSVLNEALPYWVNALVPLAYTNNDARLKAKVHEATQAILNRIQPDGWIGPELKADGKRLLWARTLLFLGWTNLVDANATWAEPIVTAMHNFNGLMNSMLKDNGTGLIYHDGDVLSPNDYSWFLARTEDMMVSLQWLLDKHPGNSTEAINENIDLLHHFGAKWEGWFEEGTYVKVDLYTLPEEVTDEMWSFLHGVTAAEGLKATAVLRRSTGNDSLLKTTKNGVDWTFEYHGSASGSILADERINGLNAYYGSELCTDVETIYSLAYLYHAIGDSDYADRAETAAFNALPAAVMGDWWSHQYMTQPNQPYAKNLTETPFYDVKSSGQKFGLEPNYPCCTVNHPQGYPKFTMYSYSHMADNGLVHSLLGPTNVKTKLASGEVEVNCTTNYPFDDVLQYEVKAEGPFNFYIRVPSWSNLTSISVTNGNQTARMDNSTRLLSLEMPKGSSSITYRVQPEIRISQRPNDTIAVYHGQLLYALHISSSVTAGPPHHYRNDSLWTPGTYPAQVHDFTILNTTAWNIAIDSSTLEYHRGVQNGTTMKLLTPTWNDGGLPMYITAKGCPIDWGLFLDSVPGVPPPLAERKCIGDVVEVKMVPYGSAKLHMSDIPTINLDS